MGLHIMEYLELKYLIVDDRHQTDTKKIKLQKCSLMCQSTYRLHLGLEKYFCRFRISLLDTIYLVWVIPQSSNLF